MIRKIIIVVLTLGAVGMGLLAVLTCCRLRFIDVGPRNGVIGVGMQELSFAWDIDSREQVFGCGEINGGNGWIQCAGHSSNMSNQVRQSVSVFTKTFAAAASVLALYPALAFIRRRDRIAMIRRMSKVSLALIPVCLAIASAASLWAPARYLFTTAGLDVWLHGGGLVVSNDLSIATMPAHPWMLPWFQRIRSSSWLFGIPLWIPTVIMAAYPTIAFIRWRRRSIPGLCSKCRYNLTGNESGVCPECGTEIESRRSSQS